MNDSIQVRSPLEDDVLTCHWHAYPFDVKSGEFLLDPAVKLETYPEEVRNGEAYVQLRTAVMNSDLPRGNPIE